MKARISNCLRQQCFFIIVIFCSALILSACELLIENEAKNIELGNIIVEALYKYQQVHDQFPEQLEDIVPDYLDKIPKTSGGKDFFYSTNSYYGFLLGFQIRSNYGCGYSNEMPEWECGYGAE